MNTFSNIFFIISSIITGIYICYYCVSLGNKHSLSFKILSSLLLFSIHYFYNNASFYFGISLPIIPFLLSVLLFIYFWCFSNYEPLTKIELSLIPNIIISFINVYAEMAMQLFVGQINYNDTHSIFLYHSIEVLQLLMKGIFCLIIVKYILKIKKDETFLLDSSTIVFSVFISFILYIVEYIRISIYSSITLISLTLFTILILKIQNESNNVKIQKEKEKQENEMLKSELALNKKYLQSQEELHLLKHDVQHILTTLKENNSSISKEVNDSLERISKIAIPLDTGNKTLDSILNIKRDVAESKDITFICTANIDNDIILSDDDLSLLLINILDNAIDHIGEGKRIEATIKKTDSRLLIRVCNSIDEEIPLTGNLYKIPANTNNRYGVKTIQKIIKKYNGILDYSQDNKILTCAISIPFGDSI